MLLINGKRARNEYFKRIGRRAYELGRAQCMEYDPTHDSEDLRGMRSSLNQLLDKMMELKVLKGYGTVWPKGAYEKWEEKGKVTFDLWLDAPIGWGASARIFEEEGVASTLLARVVEQHFSAYLVEAKEHNFNPSQQKDNTRVTIRWKLEGVL
mmetsp:Transcript_16210/g.27325  ORF Transcript_16210/g.27325 Transcript_16210/m.27325 type:complete len:153 (+) Transcript_16210:173-631(+)